MDIIKDCLVQAAVYWPPVGVVDGFNRQDYGPPEEIACRWSDKTEVVKSGGDTFDSAAQVMVDRDLVKLGRLYLAGALDSDDDPEAAARLALGLAATDPDDASLHGEAWDIKAFKRTPTLDGDEYVRTAYL